MPRASYMELSNCLSSSSWIAPSLHLKDRTHLLFCQYGFIPISSAGAPVRFTPRASLRRHVRDGPAPSEARAARRGALARPEGRAVVRGARVRGVHGRVVAAIPGAAGRGRGERGGWGGLVRVERV